MTDRSAQIKAQRRQYMALLRRTVALKPGSRDALFFEHGYPRMMLSAMNHLASQWKDREFWDPWWQRRLNEEAEKWEKKIDGYEREEANRKD